MISGLRIRLIAQLLEKVDKRKPTLLGDLLDCLRVKRELLVMRSGIRQRRAQILVRNRAQEDEANFLFLGELLDGLDQLVQVCLEFRQTSLASKGAGHAVAENCDSRFKSAI